MLGEGRSVALFGMHLQQPVFDFNQSVFHGELGHSRGLSSSGASDCHDQSTISCCDC